MLRLSASLRSFEFNKAKGVSKGVSSDISLRFGSLLPGTLFKNTFQSMACLRSGLPSLDKDALEIGALNLDVSESRELA